MSRGVQENFYSFSGGLNLVDTINDENNYLVDANNILVKDGIITNREGILKLDTLVGNRYCIVDEGATPQSINDNAILGYHTINSLENINITKATIDVQNSPTTIDPETDTVIKTKPNIRDVHVLWDQQLMQEHGMAIILNHKDLGNFHQDLEWVDYINLDSRLLNVVSGDMIHIELENSSQEKENFYYLVKDYRENVDSFYLRNVILANFLTPLTKQEYDDRMENTFIPEENKEHYVLYSDYNYMIGYYGGVVTENDCDYLGVDHSFAMVRKPMPHSAIWSENDVYNFSTEYCDYFVMYNVPDDEIMSPAEILKIGYRVLFSADYYGFNRIMYNPSYLGSDKRKIKPFRTVYDTLTAKGENFVATENGILVITSEMIEGVAEHSRYIYRSVGDVTAADTSQIDTYTRVIPEYGTYRFKNLDLNGTISLATKSDSNNTQAKMVSPIVDSDEYMQWTIEDVEENAFKIKNLKTGKYLEVTDAGKVVQNEKVNSTKQRWYFEVNGNNEFRIVSMVDGKVINVDNDNLISVQDYVSASNKQRFKLSNVEKPDGGEYTPEDSSFTRFNKLFCRGMYIYKDSIVLFGQPDNRNVIYFSVPIAGMTDITNFDDTLLFPAVNVENIETHTSGYVTAMTIFEGDLIIFKTDTILRHSGLLGSEDAERITLPTSIGTFHPNSCLIADNIIVFLTKDGLKMIQTLTEGNVKVMDISRSIKTIFEDIYYALEEKFPDKDFIDRYNEVKLHFYDNYIFIKWKGIIYRFSLNDDNWTTMSPFQDSDMIISDVFNFYIFSNKGIGKLKYNHFSDFGKPIKWRAETCNFYLQSPSEIKKFKKIFIVSKDFLNFQTGYAIITVKVDALEMGDYLVDSAKTGIFDAIRSVMRLEVADGTYIDDARDFDYSKWDSDKVAINVIKVRKKGTKFSLVLKNNSSYGRFYLYGVSVNYILKKPVKRYKVRRVVYQDKIIRNFYVDYTYFTYGDLRNYTYEDMKEGTPNE